MTLDFKEATSPIQNTNDFNINTIGFNMRNNTIGFNNYGRKYYLFQNGLHERYDNTTSIRFRCQQQDYTALAP